MKIVPVSRSAIFEIVAFALLGLNFCASALPRAWHTLNTDFPNYYVTARLAREGVDVSRAYEWIWIQREKDHQDVDQRVIGLVPITPFSTLLVMPLSKLAPLPAKHVWTVFNLLLLGGVIFMLARVSGLSVLRSAILVELSYPLQRNLLYGQYYIVLLAVLTAALWAAQRRRNGLAGTLVGFAAALKIFPILLVFYFLRKRDWQGLFACIFAVFISIVLSIAVLGVGIHRAYLQQVLPWTPRGECLPPFNLASSSISTVLHRLFVYEPQWNPHPALHAAWLFPVLHPALQALILIPAVIWIERETRTDERTALEWSGLLLAALAISPLPASYHFTVLLLPAAVVCSRLLTDRSYGRFWIAVAAFLAVGSPGWHIRAREGWGTLLCVPRLYALLCLTLLAFSLLARNGTVRRSGERMLWAAGLAVTTIVGIALGVRHQRGLFEDFNYRVPIASDVLLAAHPTALSNGGVAFIVLTRDGYRANTLSAGPLLDPQDPRADQLSLAASGTRLVTEEVSSSSTLRDSAVSSTNVDNGESPSLSSDGHTIAYLRQLDGRKQLFIRDTTRRDQPERQLTTSPMNIYEATFLPNGSLVFAATISNSKPALYLLRVNGKATKLLSGEARYPSASSDGHWLAFSEFNQGSWNLFLQDLKSGAITRLTDAPCNQIESAWEADSKTLLYATDCGRALWFTALAKRTVIH